MKRLQSQELNAIRGGVDPDPGELPPDFNLFFTSNFTDPDPGELPPDF